jgi:hypothetical protein
MILKDAEINNLIVNKVTLYSNLSVGFLVIFSYTVDIGAKCLLFFELKHSNESQNN